GVGCPRDTRPVEHTDLGDSSREHRVIVVIFPDPFAVGEEARLLVDPPAGRVHQIKNWLTGFERALLHPEELLDALARHAAGLTVKSFAITWQSRPSNSAAPVRRPSAGRRSSASNSANRPSS